MTVRRDRYTRGCCAHELTGSDQSSVMADALRTARRRRRGRRRRLCATGFLGRAALIIDFDFDTPVFCAASSSVVRFYWP
jgi:hypothetical protein